MWTGTFSDIPQNTQIEKMRLLLAAASALAVSHALASVPPIGQRHTPRLHAAQHHRSTRTVLAAVRPSGAPPSPATVPSASAADDELPIRDLLPIGLAVFVQMLGVGITLSTLPLFLIGLGGTPQQLGIVVSAFSGAQMLGCPLLVRLSGRVGRLNVMRACLAGNAIAALLTSVAPGWRSVACARILAGAFAASVPVAQAAVTDVVPPGPATSKALSRVASAASAGIICGPALGSVVAEVARRVCGVPAHREARMVFAASGCLASLVLLSTARVRLVRKSPSAVTAADGASGRSDDGPTADVQAAKGSGTGPPPYAQPLVRWTGMVTSFSVVVTITICAHAAPRPRHAHCRARSHSTPAASHASPRLPRPTAVAASGCCGAHSSAALRAAHPSQFRGLFRRALSYRATPFAHTADAIFSQTFLGYGQPQLSLTQSCGAAVGLSVQLWLLPRLIDRIGEAVSCTLGLALLGTCVGMSAVLRSQPAHALLFLASRAGLAIAETSNSALTAQNSEPSERGNNLAYLQSFQSGSRLFSPLIASRLYFESLSGRFGTPGTLPFLTTALLALLTAPVPLMLRSGRTTGAVKRIHARGGEAEGGANAARHRAP